MAAVMILRSAEQQLRIWVTSCADDVVNATAIRVEAVPVERVVRDRRERAQVRKRAPEPVASRDMRRVQRARLAGKEPLREVICVPQIEIADLRSLDADDP